MDFKKYHFLFLIILIIGCTKFVYMTDGSPDDLVNKLGFTDKLDHLVDSAGKNAVWSVLVREHPSSETLYSRNPDFNLIPASNVKLFTSAAGLKYLGEDYRFTTCLMTDGTVNKDGVLNGDLYIVGGGDPTISETFWEDNPITVFGEWSRKLNDIGIISVEGNMIGVDSFFTPQSLEPSWEWGDLRFYFAAPCGALSYNDNCINLEVGASENGEKVIYNWQPELQDITIISDLEPSPPKEKTKVSVGWLYPDSVIYISGWNEPGGFQKLYLPVTDASMFFMKTLSMVFDYAGPAVQGELKLTDTLTDTCDTLFVHHSPELKDVVKVINTESSNLYAEQLIRTLGKEILSEGSPDSGLQVVHNMLGSALIGSKNVHFTDGSGLSRHNWISAGTIADFLHYCRESEFSQAFIGSLPEYGEGTLEEREVRSPDKCEIRAKTGSMSGVRALSGYIFFRKKYYVFSIICNNYTCSSKKIEDIIDSIITELSNQ